jgi:hypothetical protein
MTDTLPNYPATRAFTITPHNTNRLAVIPRAIYVGTTGTLKVEMLGKYNSTSNTYTSNSVVTFVGVPAGTQLNIRVRKVYTIGTANNLIGLA